MTRRGNEELGNDTLTPGEVDILIDGLSDDVAFEWVLIHLEIRNNPPETEHPPTARDIESAFRSLGRLTNRGLIRLGRIQYIDGGASGRVAPVEHIKEPLPVVHRRVEAACASAKEWADWAFSCWVVNTNRGAAVARRALANE